MNDILQSLGKLIVGSVPTMVLFVLLVMLYNVLVRRPLERTLGERRARTTGAVEQARGAISAAEAETSVYEDRLRSAKAEIRQMREARAAEWAREREAVLGGVRQSSATQIEAARATVEQSTREAREQIEAASGELTQRILAALLPGRAQREGVAQ